MLATLFAEEGVLIDANPGNDRATHRHDRPDEQQTHFPLRINARRPSRGPKEAVGTVPIAVRLRPDGDHQSKPDKLAGMVTGTPSAPGRRWFQSPGATTSANSLDYFFELTNEFEPGIT